MARRWIGGMCAAVMAAVCLAAQPVTRLRTETRMVQIDVEVRDAKGRPIEGLTKDDFTISDNGKARAIQVFSVQKTSTEAVRGAGGGCRFADAPRFHQPQSIPAAWATIPCWWSPKP